MAINFDSISRGGVNQPKIAKNWGGLWRFGGGMVGNSRQPNNMGASWSYREFFWRIEPKGTEEKKVMGCRKSGMRKNPQGILENLFFWATVLLWFAFFPSMIHERLEFSRIVVKKELVFWCRFSLKIAGYVFLGHLGLDIWSQNDGKSGDVFKSGSWYIYIYMLGVANPIQDTKWQKLNM